MSQINGKQLDQPFILVSGSHFGPTGYETVVRGIYSALTAQNLNIALRSIPHWTNIRIPSLNSFTNSVRYFCSDDDIPDAHLQICLPHQAEDVLSNVNINLSMIEADRICPEWAQVADRMTCTIVPTRSSQNAWIKSGVRLEQIRICPLGTDVELFRDSQVGPLIPEALDCYRARFLNVADVSDRKNLFGLLLGWLRSTRRDDSALLVLKPGFYRGTATKEFYEICARAAAAARRTYDQAAPIVLVQRILSTSEMVALYRCGTAYISTSFGEGFDLPMIEAGVSGLHLIVPNHSAYADILNSQVAKLLPARSVAVEFKNDKVTETLFPDAKWWSPSIDALEIAIRDHIEEPKKDLNLATDHLSQFSWESSSAKMYNVIREFTGSGKK